MQSCAASRVPPPITDPRPHEPHEAPTAAAERRALELLDDLIRYANRGGFDDALDLARAVRSGRVWVGQAQVRLYLDHLVVHVTDGAVRAMPGRGPCGLGRLREALRETGWIQ